MSFSSAEFPSQFVGNTQGSMSSLNDRHWTPSSMTLAERRGRLTPAPISVPTTSGNATGSFGIQRFLMTNVPTPPGYALASRLPRPPVILAPNMPWMMTPPSGPPTKSPVSPFFAKSPPKPKRLHVSNIPFMMNGDDLKYMFQAAGTVIDAEVITNERGSKGFGFVTFANEADAEVAKRIFSNCVVGDRILEVNDALPKNRFRFIPSREALGMAGAEEVLKKLVTRHNVLPPPTGGCHGIRQRSRAQATLPPFVVGRDSDRKPSFMSSGSLESEPNTPEGSLFANNYSLFGSTRF